LDLCGIKPCQDLIQQQKPGMSGQSSSYLQPLTLREAERRRGVMSEGSESGDLQNLICFLVNLLGRTLAWLSEDSAGFDVFKHGHIGERAYRLERSGDAQVT